MAFSSILDDLIAFYLPTAGLNLTFGTNLFASLLPDLPDAATAAFEYPGDFGLDTFQVPTLPVGLATMEGGKIQIICRDTTTPLVRSTIDGVYKALAKLKNTTVNGTYYVDVGPEQAPFFLHRDATRRVYYAVNFKILRTPR